MEYALWEDQIPIKMRMFPGAVLILILMEYALWAWGAARDSGTSPRLNPYSNGICSLRKKREVPRTY